VPSDMAAGWRRVLGVPGGRRRDDFVGLAGHALLATQIISRVRQACDIALPLRALFEASELGAFAEQVECIQQSGARSSLQPIAHVDRRQPVPLSYSQQRMWFLWQMEPDSPAHNVGGMARLDGVLHLESFGAALPSLVLRPLALRPTLP
ncbi:hypothetical protein EWW49_33660, partial [Pseudomonas syringae]